MIIIYVINMSISAYFHILHCLVNIFSICVVVVGTKCDNTSINKWFPPSWTSVMM